MSVFFVIRPRNTKARRQRIFVHAIFQVKEKVEQCVKDKADHHIIALTFTHDLIVAEDKYHPSCYTNLTGQKKNSVSSTSSGKFQETDEYKRVELETLKITVECCFKTINQSMVFKFKNFCQS